MILNLLGLIALLAIGFKFIRSIIGMAWYVALFAGLVWLYANTNGSSASVSIPSYDELKNYALSCDKADEQLKYLKSVQSALKLPNDPDSLSENDRIYNSRLKATIWWYAYTCGKS